MTFCGISGFVGFTCNRKRFFWFLSEEIVHPFVRRESAFFLSEEGMHPFLSEEIVHLCLLLK